MADKSIGELIPATSVTPTDLFVLEQNNTAKKLTGQVLENWLVSFADGHGGIQSIKKQETSGLNDTYRITLADTTTFDFVVTNGKGITGIYKTSTGGLVDTYTIRYNDSTTSTFTVTNGAKGDKGDNAYTWFKYASEKPTSSSSSMGDEPDNWLGVYSGNKSEPPTDPMEYTWSLIKGEKGQTGDPATIVTNKTEYQVSDSGTIIPSGIWSTSIPVVTPGKFLWARTTTQFNTGTPNYSYSISRFGIDGTGSVVTVNGVSPDEFGNVELTAEQLECLGLAGGTMTGPIHMSGQVIDGLNDPTGDTEAARKAYVDKSVREAAPVNLLDNSDFRNPVNQRGVTTWNYIGYGIDRWFTSGTSANIFVTGNGLQGSATYLVQRFEINKLRGATKVTAAVKVNGAVYSGVADISNFGTGANINMIPVVPGTTGVYLYSETGTVAQFYFIAPSDVIIEWAALYPGEYSGENLPEYHPKGYATELAECRRYYYTSPVEGVRAGAVVTLPCPSLSFCPLNAQFPVSMRIIPTVTITSVLAFSGSSNPQTSALTTPEVSSGGFSYIQNNNNDFTVTEIYYVKYQASADL